MLVSCVIMLLKYIITLVLSGRVHRVMVECVLSEDVRMISVLFRSSVLGPLLFLLYASDLSNILE